MPTKVGTNEECLTFGDLKFGQKFISKPVAGDNSGHGGFAGVHHIFLKVTPPSQNWRAPDQPDNAVDSRGIMSHIPDTMEVIPVA